MTFGLCRRVADGIPLARQAGDRGASPQLRRRRVQAAQLEAPYDAPYDQDQYDEDPRTLAEMARRAEQRNPNILDQLFGNQPGPLNNPLVKMALAGAAAMAARRFLGGQANTPLGGLFGNQLGGSQSTGFSGQRGQRFPNTTDV
jgi:hypothetical protein